MKARQHISWIFLMLILGGHTLLGQNEFQLNIVEVEMNEASETVDIYLHAIRDGKEFADFRDDDHALQVTETIFPGTKKNAFLDVKYWPIKDSTRFGEKVMIQILTQSQENTHKENRQYEVSWIYKGQNVSTITYEKNWGFFAQNQRQAFSFQDLFILGLFLASLVLFILSEGIPLIRGWQFRKQYVEPYALVKGDDERGRHPITGEYIRKDELVVNMCDKPYCRVPLDVWEKRNYQCMHYPLKCEGNPNIGTKQFFNQAGIFRQLNWLWFGILGGLVGWTMVYSLEVDFLFKNVNDLWQNIIIGAGLGTGLSFMLSWVEERGQSRRLNWGRILLRTGVGGIAAGLIFFFGYYLESWIGIPWIAGPLVWLLFSISLGFILSIDSTIPLRRGIFSGLIAGAISSVLYGILLYSFDDVQVARLLAFTLNGGIMGFGIIQIVKQLQTVKIEVLAPSYRSGWVFELDRWLQAGEEVVIGQHKKNIIKIKWEDDFALPHHARLKMVNDKVTIEPIENAELWINDQPLSKGKSHILRNGEKISFARNSPTILKYLQKTANA